MALYRLKDGSHTTADRRGQKVTYKAKVAGRDVMDLTPEQAHFLRHRIEPAGAAPVPAPAAAEVKPPKPEAEKTPEPEKPAEPKAPEPEPAGPWDAVLAGNVGHVSEELAKLTDLDEIRALAAAELKRENPRKGVATAVEERIAAIEADRG